MPALSFVDACTEEHYAAISLIHAMGWRETYADAIPKSYMDQEITDQRWIPFLRECHSGGVNHGLLLYDGTEPVCSAVYGPARIGAQAHGGTMTIAFDAEQYRGWGEIISIYTHPRHTGKGYGHAMVQEIFRRMKAQGFAGSLVYVLRENQGARRFYEREGFSWDGNWTEIPFPPDTICNDLRYACPFSS